MPKIPDFHNMNEKRSPIFLELIQGTKEWHEWRSQGIGASDAPIIMGVSPWVTPISLWFQKKEAMFFSKTENSSGPYDET